MNWRFDWVAAYSSIRRILIRRFNASCDEGTRGRSQHYSSFPGPRRGPGNKARSQYEQFDQSVLPTWSVCFQRDQCGSSIIHGSSIARQLTHHKDIEFVKATERCLHGLPEGHDEADSSVGVLFTRERPGQLW